MKIGIIACEKMIKIGCPGKEACVSCFKAINEKSGAFERYKDVELVAFTNCGGCPGKRYPSRIKLLKNACNAEAIHIANCSLGEPKCPYIDFEGLSEKLMKELGIPIIFGTHNEIKRNVLVCNCEDKEN
ncbi:CGGC domain-containing protein [Methanothermococcus sp. SCGC AD-155-M21]|nr:CGGC domain-containing protein [Methanothermococcus sp. SCGC AD-155-M21]